MNKKMTRAVALAMTGAVMSSLLVGCGGKESSAPSASTPSAPSDGGSAEPQTTVNTEIYPLDSDITFEVACANSKANEFSQTALWEEVTGVDIEWFGWDDEQVNMALSSKTLPDAFYGTTAIDKAKAYEYGEAGIFVNFADYMDIMPNFSAMLERFPEARQLVENPDGSIYSLPRIGTTATTHGNLLYFRTDMMEEIGWEEPPKTTEEFVDYIKAAQEHFGATDPDFVAFDGYKDTMMDWRSETGMAYYFFPAFGELVATNLTTTPDGKTVVLGAATEQYRHYLEFMNEVYESGAFSKNVYTEDGTASRALTSENQVAISPFASYLTPANFESGEMELTILEPLTSQYWDTKHWKPRSSANWSGTVVSSSCKDIETMVRWLDSQYATQDNPLTEDGNIWGLSFWLGEYGKDFTLDKEAKEYKILDHEGYESGSTWLSSNSFGYTLGLDDFLYVEKSNTGLEIKGRGTIDNLMPYAERPFDMNSIALEPEERDNYTDRWTDIDNYIKESTAKFITGELDIASGWDKYLADLDNMGLPEVLEIYQTAYDRQSA